MANSRSEEARRARDLHLLRDERDLEVQEKGERKSGWVVLTLSQTLAALCILQEDPAWTVLLSLSFAAGAVRAFHQFACDREGLYLFLGIAGSAIALILCGWFFLEHWPGWLTLGRLAALVVLFQAMKGVAALLFLGLTLGAFWAKFKVQRMDGEKWDAYFRNLPTTALLVRLGVLMGAALLAATLLSYVLLGAFGFPAPLQLAAVFCVMSAVRLVRKFSARREELVEKLLRFKPADGSN